MVAPATILPKRVLRTLRGVNGIRDSGSSIQDSGLNPMMKLSNPSSSVKPESYITEYGPES